MTKKDIIEDKELDMDVKLSNIKKDSAKIANLLSKKFKIHPYNVEELSLIVLAALRTGEIQLEKNGRSYKAKNVCTWFKERLMPNTIILTENDYKTALYRAFRLLIMADIAKTDFGSSRQRDFGQIWTDFTRGFLGEIGIEKFFKEKFGVIVKLEEKAVGDVKTFLPTDISKVVEKGKERKVNKNISIKTSKLGSMWLDIGTQLVHSDAFIFIKIGLTVDHLVHFFKSNGFLKDLVKMGKELKEVENCDEEFKKLSDKIPDTKPFPAYISGFVWKKDMEDGKLEIYETKSKSPKKIIIGGCGLFSKDTANAVEGLGEISPPKYLACISSLRWDKENWDNLKNSI